MTVDEIVLDTSAAVDALLDRPAPPRLLDRLAQADLHSPHLVDIELLSVLRRLLHGKEISLHQALDAQTDFADLRLTRYPHTGRYRARCPAV